jgi:hypothetical protein
MRGDPNHGFPQYRCSGRDWVQSPKDRCVAHVNAQSLDAVVWKTVCEPFKNPAKLRTIIERNQTSFKCPEAKRRATELTEHIERLKQRESRAAEALLDSTLSRQHELFRRKLQQINDEQRKLERERKALQLRLSLASQGDVDGTCREIAGVIDRLVEEQMQEFVRRIVERISVTGEDVEIRCAVPPLPVLGAQNWPQRADDRAAGIGKDHARQTLGRRTAAAEFCRGD